MSNYEMSAEYQRKVGDFVYHNIMCCVSTLIYELREVYEQMDDSDTYLELVGGNIDYAEAAECYIDELSSDDLWEAMNKDLFIYDVLAELGIEPTMPELARFCKNEGMYEIEEDDEGDELGYRGQNTFLYDTIQALLEDSEDDLDAALVTWRDEGEAFDYLTKEDLDKLRAYLLEHVNAEEFCYDHDIDLDDYRREPYEFWAVDGWFGARLREHGETVVGYMGLTIWGRCCSGQSISLDGVVCEIYNELHEKELSNAIAD